LALMAYTDSQTERKSNRRQWRQPRLIAIHYPTTIANIRDRDRWIAAMMLDAELTARDQTILTRLALHLNLKTGRCDPSVGLLAMEVSIRGADPERAARRSLAKGERKGWIRRTSRHGGDAKRQSQTNNYALIIPDWATTGKDCPVEQSERPDKTTTDDRTKRWVTTGQNVGKATGHYCPPNSESMNSEMNNEIRTEDSTWVSDEERKWKAKKEQNPNSSSNSKLPSLPSTPPPDVPRGPPSPELVAALERLDKGVRGNGGLTAGSSDVTRALRWRQ
jgi:hypothetical protein